MRARANLLQALYAIYDEGGALAYTESSELARRLVMDDETVENAAAQLRMRNLVSFDACDRGLLNLRLTPHGVEQLENPSSTAEWHSSSTACASHVTRARHG